MFFLFWYHLCIIGDIGIFEASDEFIARGEDKFQQAIDLYKYFFVEEHDLDQYVLRGIL